MDDFEIKLRKFFDKAMENIGLVVADNGREFLFALYMSGFTTGAIHGALNSADEEIVKLAKKISAVDEVDEEIIH